MRLDGEDYVIRLDGSEVADKSLIGGKAWSISRMKELGVPVPPAFVLSTDACRYFLANGTLPEVVESSLRESIGWLEGQANRRFSGSRSPLLVSVRSGAEISMPGMMDTVLNLGMNQEVEQALATEFADAEFARDTHCRFLRLYSEIVLKQKIFSDDSDDPAKLADAIAAEGGVIPESGFDQLIAAIEAVFLSWNSRRAKRYRKHNGISDSLGTAVTVQAMVFGNLDEESGTGVLFSRNPLDGFKQPYGEYLAHAQGEDIVSGKVTPKPLSDLKERNIKGFDELLEATNILEVENKEVQDIEFTIQAGKLFLLQSRTAKRAPAAALRFAIDFVEEGLIDRVTAVKRLTIEQLKSVLAPNLAGKALEGAKVVLKGEPACPGVGQGILVTTSEMAESKSMGGDDVVLGCNTTSPEDIHGMIVSKALVTELGGATSHAAVVGRSLGIPTIVKCGEGEVVNLGERKVTVDGNTGTVYDGYLPLSDPEEESLELKKLAAWLRELSPLNVLPLSEAVDSKVLDLDTIEGGDSADKLPILMEGYSYVKGSILDSQDGIEAAVRVGVENVIVIQPITAMLAAVKSTQ